VQSEQTYGHIHRHENGNLSWSGARDSMEKIKSVECQNLISETRYCSYREPSEC
jgi:hypothetical protein